MTPSKRSHLVAFAACALLLSGCSGDDEDGGAAAPVGTLIDSVVTVNGTTDYVMTPEGRINVTIAPPASELSGFDETYDRAAEGASLVGVEWSYEIESNPRTMNDPEADPVVPHFTLVADGEEYSLDEAMIRDADRPGTSGMPLEFRGTLAVAVEGEPSETSVRVDYDGVVQEISSTGGRVETEGPESLLYGSPADLLAQSVPCGQPTYEQPQLSVDPLVCEITVARVPYRAGLGWAEDGARWLTVRGRLQVGAVFWRQGAEDETYYGSDEVSDELRLGDLEPADTTLPEDGLTPETFAVYEIDDGVPGLADVELAPLSVVAAVTSSGDYPSTPGAPTDPGVVVRWSVPLD